MARSEDEAEQLPKETEEAPGDTSTTEEKAKEAGTTTSVRVFASAYSDWVRAQQEAWLDYQQRCTIAYLEMVARQQQLQTEAWRPVEEAYAKFLQAGSGIGLDRDSWQSYQNAYQKYIKAQWEYSVNEEFQNRFMDAYKAYLQAQREASDAAQNRCREAQQAYLRKLKEAWAEIDPEKLDPAIIYSIKLASGAIG